MKRSEMPLRKRLQYIWDYYKVPMAAGAVILYIILYTGWRYLTRQDLVLYGAVVNVGISEEIREQFEEFPRSEAFARNVSEPSARSAVSLSENLFLLSDADSEYHAYVYASRLKILAAIEAGKLDLVIGDAQAMDAFAGQGFLLPLEGLFEEKEIQSRLREGTVILEDNHLDVLLDESIPYEAVTKTELTAIDLTGLEGFVPLAGDSRIYLGIIANSERRDAALAFAESLFQVP